MPKTYLAFDYGTQRTGLAVGNDLLRTVQAIPAISTREIQHADGRARSEAVRTLVREWKIAHLVFGLPLDSAGEETRLSQRIRELGEQLGAQLQLPVSFSDERYSSGSADRLLREGQPAGKRFTQRKIAARDSVAAQLILETFFTRLPD